MTPESLGRYRIADLIGRGAMGIVYRARDPIIDRVVALKTLDPHLTGEALRHFNERFFREAKSAGRLNHPNIVTIYDAGEADGNAYIAMEYLEGPSLRQVLDDQPALPVSRVMEIGAQVARGLAYAHEHGVVHRDVKPANVILVNGRRPKITDFGIAGAAGDVSSELAGSPKYMSPEQVRGEPLDGRADLFSLGAVLYELLTGKQPFTGESVDDIIAAVREHEPPPPSTLNPRVSPEVDRVVMRMLAKHAEDRYTTARRAMRHLVMLAERVAEAEKLEAGTAIEPPPAPREPGERSGEETTVVLGMAPPAPRRAGRYWGMAAVAAIVIAAAAWSTRPDTVVEPMVVTRLKPAAAAPVSAPAPVPEVETPPPAPTPVVQAAPVPRPAVSAAARPSRKPPVEVVQPPAPVVEPEPAPKAAPPREIATLQLAVSPWGEVFIDGESRGTSPPLASIQVPPGTYRVEVRNSTLTPYRAEVSLGSGDTRRIKHRFE